MDYTLYLLIIIIGFIIFVVISRNRRWPLYLFFALYAVLPEYLAIEFSASLPLLTASRLVLLILCGFYILKHNKTSTVHVLKKESLNTIFLVYFTLRLIANGVYILSVPDALKEILVIVFEEMILLIVVLGCIPSKEVFNKCVRILVYASSVIFVIGIFQAITGTNIAYFFNTVSRYMLQASTERIGFTRAEATFGHPVYFGQFCAMISPLIMYLYENTSKKRYLIILALDIIALLLSNSRGSIIAFICVIAFMFIDKKEASRRKYYGFILITILSTVVTSLFMPEVLGTFVTIFKSVLNTFGFNYELSNYGENLQGLESRLKQFSEIIWVLRSGNFLFGLGANPHIRGLVHVMNADGIWYQTTTMDVGYVAYFLSEGLFGIVGVMYLLSGLFLKSVRWSNRNQIDNMNNAFKYCFLMYFILIFSAVGSERTLWIIIALFISYNNLKIEENRQT